MVNGSMKKSRRSTTSLSPHTTGGMRKLLKRAPARIVSANAGSRGVRSGGWGGKKGRLELKSEGALSWCVQPRRETIPRGHKANHKGWELSGERETTKNINDSPTKRTTGKRISRWVAIDDACHKILTPRKGIRHGAEKSASNTEKQRENQRMSVHQESSSKRTQAASSNQPKDGRSNDQDQA